MDLQSSNAEEASAPLLEAMELLKQAILLLEQVGKGRAAAHAQLAIDSCTVDRNSSVFD